MRIAFVTQSYPPMEVPWRTWSGLEGVPSAVISS